MITADGQPVALLVPLKQRPQWISTTEFLSRMEGRQADPELLDEDYVEVDGLPVILV